MDLIGARGAGIAHCPLSNAYFSNAVFPLRRAIEKGLHVGLGTDISGGPERIAARQLPHGGRRLAHARGRRRCRLPRERGAEQDSRIDWKTAFHLATAGGAESAGPAGRPFRAGRQFRRDRRRYRRPGRHDPALRRIDDLETVLQKIIYTASRANIARCLGRRAGASPERLSRTPGYPASTMKPSMPRSRRIQRRSAGYSSCSTPKSRLSAIEGKSARSASVGWSPTNQDAAVDARAASCDRP